MLPSRRAALGPHDIERELDDAAIDHRGDRGDVPANGEQRGATIVRTGVRTTIGTADW